MKIRRTLAWGTIGLALMLALAGCCSPTRKALPDVEPTAVGAEGAPLDEDAQATAMIATSNARATQTAQAAIAPDTSEETPVSPLITPTVAPTAIPPTAVPPTAVPATAAPAPTTPPTGEVTYVVRRGDTLYSIARRYGTTVEAIATANGIANPNQIRVGQTLKIYVSGSPPSPPPSGGTTYVVKPGDNLFRIALRYGMSYLYLAQYNGIADPSRIYVGQVIRIPPH
jgi:LysM repeat protein